MFDASHSQSLRPIAFYLPQYHPTPENDAFWGKGFTDWRNVARARPRFSGHAQPHIPADLGFYDLRLSDTRHAQAAMARASGLAGFCWHHYWFSGRRVLNEPFDQVLADESYDFPFMLSWANENWTRSWDGGETEVILPQSYSDTDTANHARYLAPVFADARYIRINGRPVFAVYNTDDLPDPARWSDVFRETLLADRIDPFLVRVERYLDQDTRRPRHFGFDAALEFQPFSRNFRRWQRTRPDLRRNIGRRVLNRVTQIRSKFRDSDTHHDLRAFVEYDMQQPPPDYTCFPGVCPSWDNSARRPKGKGIIFRNLSLIHI